MKNVEGNDSPIVASMQSSNGKLGAGSSRSGYGSNEVVEVHNPLRIEGMNRSISEVISNKMPTSHAPKTPPNTPRNKLVSTIAIAKGTVISLLFIVGVYGLRSLLAQWTPSSTPKASPLTSNALSSQFGSTGAPETLPAAFHL